MCAFQAGACSMTAVYELYWKEAKRTQYVTTTWAHVEEGLGCYGQVN